MYGKELTFSCVVMPTVNGGQERDVPIRTHQMGGAAVLEQNRHRIHTTLSSGQK